MTARLITPPAALAVSLDAARTAARQDGAAADAELTLAIKTYTDEAEFETQRALVEQTWRVTLDRFPQAIQLPRPPLLAVQHVKFYDVDGQLQTLDPQDYMTDDESEPSYIVPAPGAAWPATMARINAVQVQYTVGYGPDHTTVPAAIQGYILGKIAMQFGQTGNMKMEYLPRLLDGCRVYA
ncbi:MULTISPECIES: hypothetical protein [unclassified Massilia]|uniref:head-tail connector protein n=1 Tax=unclassified Massilia TaxID=2609279 RepID=UPI0017872C94|nr:MULTISPECIES: hypothetical protein [unclassified Massilia]MBD8531571.1 hypothetical protein [Massilia sp. CFBP 13647]MBD8673633.1 hypothetical protein [Massilia sp. CFBP 13721]